MNVEVWFFKAFDIFFFPQISESEIILLSLVFLLSQSSGIPS